MKTLGVHLRPTDATTHEGFEIASYNVSTLIYRKEKMLAPVPPGRALIN